jgi:hypothetical protein
MPYVNAVQCRCNAGMDFAALPAHEKGPAMQGLCDLGGGRGSTRQRGGHPQLLRPGGEILLPLDDRDGRASYDPLVGLRTVNAVVDIRVR